MHWSEDTEGQGLAVTDLGRCAVRPDKCLKSYHPRTKHKRHRSYNFQRRTAHDDSNSVSLALSPFFEGLR